MKALLLKWIASLWGWATKNPVISILLVVIAGLLACFGFKTLQTALLKKKNTNLKETVATQEQQIDVHEVQEHTVASALEGIAGIEEAQKEEEHDIQTAETHQHVVDIHNSIVDEFNKL